MRLKESGKTFMTWPGWLHQQRIRRAVAGLILVGAVAVGVSVLSRRFVEHPLHERIVSAARRRGFDVQIGAVHVGFLPSLEFDQVAITSRAHGARLETSNIRISFRPWARGLGGPALRVHLGSIQATLPAGLRIDCRPTSWDVARSGGGGGIRVRQVGSAAGQAEVSWPESGGRTMLDLNLQSVTLSNVVQIRLGDTLIAHPGVVDVDAVMVETDTGTVERRLIMHGRAQGMQLALLQKEENAAGASTTVSATGPFARHGAGAPVDIVFGIDAALNSGAGTLDIRRLHLQAGKAAASCRVRVTGGLADPHVDVQFEVKNVDFAELLSTAGLGLPRGVSELGVASLDAHVRGRINDPQSISVSRHVAFAPPRRTLPAIQRLRGPFVHEAVASDGRRFRISVSPESPSFMALPDVPPLFLRALLLSEDADFYGHNGFELSEMPVALATNWRRGTIARGASTITQQLAKNLFLSREKSISRKLQELALTMLLESTLGKQRILEIYLNVIEWGPGIYGLRSASAHYFGKEPVDLTTKELAFLVALIPGPIKYQISFASGTLSPSFEQLVNGVLAKLRSVDAITEEEYQAALAEQLHPGDPGPNPPPSEDTAPDDAVQGGRR